ncbi:MAG TPA: SDR family oxidoreductase [Acidimicrobiia bacterium]|nr:SDR family oxidoreductase [Acidimicrobiia bacterium]
MTGRTIAVTGSAGGIGGATRARLERDGHRVIGVDVRDAEVVADLATPAGRSGMIEAVARACGGALDGVVAGAGVMGDEPSVISINYFGAVATLEGLRPLLARGRDASAVAISSNSTTTTPALPVALVDTLLGGDEDAARAAAADHAGRLVLYPASKLALARWVRRHAIGPDWIGAGIRLNAVAPGVIDTPMTKDGMEFIFSIPDVFPVPIGRPGRPEEIASLLAYLLSPEAGFFCGSVVFADGGSDAAVRPDDFPSPRP